MENTDTNSNSGYESFAQAFEISQAGAVNNIRPGKIVTGTVVEINREVVTIDIGFKSDGVVPTSQFMDAEGIPTIKKGDKVDVCILSFEGDSGQVQLSKEKADQLRIWRSVEDAFKTGAIIKGTVMMKVKGGLQVDIGIPAFLPGSQIDIRPHRNLDKFLGETQEYKVLKITRDKGNIVLSRRAVLVNERDSLRGETLKVLSDGVVMEGVVKNVTDYGAFIDLGGIDGLLHITDISWGRVNHPSEKISVGQTIPVVVLKYDGDKERVSLGMKQLKPDPWLTVHERFPINGKISGRVTSVADYGVFVEIEDGVEGLIHVSEMSWTKRVKHPSKIVSEGDAVEAVILGIDTEQRRIALGLKQLMPNPWVELQQRLPVGTRVSGKVRSIVDYGVFIGIEEGIDGLVHVSDVSWTKRIRDPKELQDMFSKGADVEAVVLGIDAENERLSLGIKQLATDPWESISQRFPAGVKVKGKVISHTDFGVFLEIEEGVEGLIHNSQSGLDKEANLQEAYPMGSMVEAEIINLDRDERRISLSVRSIRRRQEKEQMAEYMQENSGGVTFGDLLQDKLNKGQ
jgi:small subunit ribosomal protein S1